jgi:hypothetical protein
MGFPIDRARLAAIEVLHLIAATSPEHRSQALEDFLRDEYADIQRQAVADCAPVEDDT